MLISAIVVAALLFCVAFVILADACRPSLSLHLCDTPATHEEVFQGDSTYAPSEMDDTEWGLSDEDRDGFFQVWHSVRNEFDADPNETVLRADLLMSDLIEDYRCPPPLEPRLDLLNDGPLEMQYRSAHEIAVRSKEGCAKPYELKRAICLYTVLFDELLREDKNAGDRRAA